MTLHDIQRPGATTHARVGEQSLQHRREFSAPAALVQRAHTDPAMFTRWMGPRGTTVLLDRFDATTGGAFRYIVRSSNGESWPFRGSYHLVADATIIHTWEHEDHAGPTLEVLQFTDLPDGRSTLTISSTFASKQACDAMLASGMDAGMDEDFERLDTVLDQAATSSPSE